MVLFLENTEQLNNYINISNKIQSIPLFFIHFLPIIDVKNIDENYRLIPELSTENKSDIKYKIIRYDNSITKYHLYSYVFFENNFARSLYHIFYSSYLLHEHNISFTPNNDDPFISYQDNLPILNEFSYSFYFPKINVEHLEHIEHLKQYFPIQLLNNNNTYISIDVFLIAYMLHHNIKRLTEIDSIQIINAYMESREKIDIKSLKQIITYFHGYESVQIIQYLFQFKYTWTYYSLCYYFVLHHPVLLKHFSLFDLFSSYIRSNFKDRDSNIISSIHCRLFG
jgi:hypothetical protein|tara:strand:- start:4 stop:849 length:846 start_codon:yes stop_codon:yes gene_type:complete